MDLLRDNWGDVPRVAGSLRLGAVRASDLLRALNAGTRRSELAKAIAEVGRVAKSHFLPSYVEDESHRRRAYSSSSTAARPVTSSPGSSSTATGAGCESVTARAKRNSSPRSGWY